MTGHTQSVARTCMYTHVLAHTWVLSIVPGYGLSYIFHFPDEETKTQRGKGLPKFISLVAAKQTRTQALSGWIPVLLHLLPPGLALLVPTPLLIGCRHKQDFLYNRSIGFDFQSRACFQIPSLRSEGKTTTSCNSLVLLLSVSFWWMGQVFSAPLT